MTEKTTRSFRIVSVDDNVERVPVQEGIYHGRGPGQAALKAFNWFCRKADREECESVFTIREVTKGGKKKEYTYLGIRTKLDEPKILKRGDQEYPIQYDTKIRKHT